MSTYYDILKRPKGGRYKALIRFALARSSSLGLVVGAATGCNSTDFFQKTLRNLEPFLIETRVTDNWPGTRVLGYEVQLLRYYAKPEILPILLSVKSLYDWQYPNAPEDLHFYTATGDCWLASTAHDAIAWVCAEVCPRHVLQAEVPGIVLAKRSWQGGT